MSDMAVHRKALPVVASSTFVAIWTAWWAWHMWPNSGLSWHFSVDGARLLLQGYGLNLYADAPWLQTGPLSLVVAALLRPLPANIGKSLALAVMTMAGPLLIGASTTIAEFLKYVGISAPIHARRKASNVNVVGRPSFELCQSASVRSELLSMK